MRNFDDMYMEIAHSISKQSRARRVQVGALLVKDDNILSFGYNGTPSGFDNNCEEPGQGAPVGINGDFTDLVTRKEVLHAESNALMKIARSTQSSDGSTLYLTLSPCFECAKLIVQSGVKRVVFGQQYRDDSPITFLEQLNIKVEKYERTIPLGRTISPAIDPRMYSPGEPEEGFYDPSRER